MPSPHLLWYFKSRKNRLNIPVGGCIFLHYRSTIHVDIEKLSLAASLVDHPQQPIDEIRDSMSGNDELFLFGKHLGLYALSCEQRYIVYQYHRGSRKLPRFHTFCFFCKFQIFILKLKFLCVHDLQKNFRFDKIYTKRKKKIEN